MSGAYEPKNILLTGGAGFIGSHVVSLLVKKYNHYKIICIDRLSYCSNVRNIADVSGHPNFRFVQGDIRSADLVNYILTSENIDTIMHFAAQTHVDNSFGNSFAFTKDNIDGTHVLLESARAYGRIRRFLHVSTDEVYGETSFELASSNLEDISVLNPTNPYSASKAAAEMLVMAYGKSYNLNYVITRGNNVYGPHQYPEKAIPKFAILASAGDQVPVHGDGTMARSYLHVSDAARAFDVILHKAVNQNVYNIGTDQERDILSVATDICALTNRDPKECIKHVDDRAYNDRRYYIDVTKLRGLGWEQEICWEEGLAQTVAWYTSAETKNYWGDLASALEAHPTRSHRESI